MSHDPAARHPIEVALTYPGLHALWLHRAAHALWRRDLVLGPRLLAHVNRFVTGIEIHPGARIGDRVFIDHGMGVVIGETSIVGDGCLIYKGVVLGGTTLERKQRHPILGQNVVVGSNACVLGALSIGDGARIGSGSVVIKDVPPGATVVGVPGRIVQSAEGAKKGPIGDPAWELDHANLPDPVAEAVKGINEQSARLVRRVQELEEKRAASVGGGARAARRPRPRRRGLAAVAPADGAVPPPKVAKARAAGKRKQR